MPWAANGLALTWYSLGHRVSTMLPATANGSTWRILVRKRGGRGTAADLVIEKGDGLFVKTNWKEKSKAMVREYIAVCQQECYDDAQIIDVLAEIFTREELESLGYGDFIRNYFDDAEG